MKQILIDSCVDCPFSRRIYWDAENVGGWWCQNFSDRFRQIQNGTTIPDWCPLDDAPELSGYDIAHGQIVEEG